MEINRIELQQYLDLLQKCSSASINEDISDKVMFYSSGIANVSRSRMLTFLACDVGFDGVFQLETILKIVKSLSGDEITFSMDEDELKLSSSKSKLGLKSILIENWKSKYVDAAFKFIEDKKFKPIQKNFIEAIQAVHQCALDDKNASILSNVAVIEDNMIASDNYKIGHHKISKKFESNFLIDRYNVAGIIAFKPESYCLCDDRIIFRTEDHVQMCAINPMAKYPNFFPVLSREESSVSITLPDEVKEAVNIAQQIPGKTEDSQMKLILSKHKLSLAYNTINGWFKRNIRIDYGGQPITFSMNVNVLNDALRNIGNELLMSTEGTGMMKLGSFNFVFPLEIEES